MTPLCQSILDTICDVVAAKLGPGFIGWSIGKEVEITHFVAKRLAKSEKTVDGGLAYLVREHYLDNNLETDSTWEAVKREVAITHKGWQAWSSWKPDEELFGCESLEMWLEWDGIDGTEYPYRYKMPNWKTLRTTKKT